MGDERATDQIHYLPPAPSSRQERVGLALYATFIVGCVIAAVFYHSGVAVLYAVTAMIALSYQLVKLRRGSARTPTACIGRYVGCCPGIR